MNIFTSSNIMEFQEIPGNHWKYRKYRKFTGIHGKSWEIQEIPGNPREIQEIVGNRGKSCEIMRNPGDS